MNRIFQYFTSLLLGVLLLYAVFWRFDVRKTLEFLRQAHPTLLIAGIALMVVAYLLRGVRWRIWERRLSYWDALRLILIGFMGNNVLPARLGEVLRAHCAAGKTSDERGRTAALGSIAAERILDAFMLAVFAIVGLVLVPVDRRLQWALGLVSLGFAGLGLGFVIGIRVHEQVRHAVVALNKKFPGRGTDFLREKTGQFFDGFLPLAPWRRMLAALFCTAVIWSLELGLYYCTGRAVYDNFSLRIAILSVAVVNFASIIPLSMGGIGTIEAVTPVFLISAGIPPYAALAMVLLQHAGQYLFTSVSGGVLYLAGGFYRIPLLRSGVVVQRGPSTESVLGETKASVGQLGANVKLQPASRSEIELSIVIPAYNEQVRLPPTVLETLRWCATRNLEFEIIIVDDGSRDETLALARIFEESDFRVRALACPHMGKGAAVRMGMLNARGLCVLFMDADRATPLDEIPKLLAAIQDGHDVAIGSRAQRSGEVEVKRSFGRSLVGRTFSFFVNVFALRGIADTQCGFKMFRRDAAAAVFGKQKLDGFAFDVEILLIARRLSLAIAEVSVNWTAQPGSKLNLVSDSVKMLWDICHVRWLHRNFLQVSREDLFLQSAKSWVPRVPEPRDRQPHAIETAERP